MHSHQLIVIDALFTHQLKLSAIQESISNEYIYVRPILIERIPMCVAVSRDDSLDARIRPPLRYYNFDLAIFSLIFATAMSECIHDISSSRSVCIFTLSA